MSGSEVGGEEVEALIHWLEERNKMRYSNCGHKFNISEEEQLFLVVPAKGRPLLHLPRGICVQSKVVLLYFQLCTLTNAFSVIKVIAPSGSGLVLISLYMRSSGGFSFS